MKYQQIFLRTRIHSQDKDYLTLAQSFRQTRKLLRSDFFLVPSIILMRLFHAAFGEQNERGCPR